MSASILRVLRVLVAQAIGLVITTYGAITIPYFSITVGVLLNGVFKFIRDKFPKSVILEYLPL